MSIKMANEIDKGIIDSYVDKCGLANLYHDSRWGNIVEKCFGHKYYSMFSENTDGVIDGVLPLVHMKSMTFGNSMVSMPYFNYGGVCASDGSTQNRLIEEAVHLAKELKAQHIEFRQEKPLNNGFSEKTHKVSMRLGLPDSSDELWKSFPSKLRSQIKLPQKAGITCAFGRFEELASFYTVFSVNMRSLGTPVYPKLFFKKILDEFPENAWICSIYMGAVPVASGFLVGFKKRMEIPWASSVRSYNRFSPNMLLYWSCLKFACEQGYTTFDFGRSTLGESTCKFKEQWGAKPYPMIWSYWVREGGNLPELSPRNPKYQLAIGIWKRLPLHVTQILGPRIIKNIP